MSNALAKDLEIMFEEYVEGYDAACVISNEAEKSYPDAQTMQRAGDTFYVKQNYQASIITGLDISASTPVDLIERMVPTVYRTPDNVLFKLDAKEMRDPEHKKRMGRAASERLAAEIDKNLYTTVANRAGIVIKKVGAFTWDDGATAEAMMVSRGIAGGRQKKLFLNPFDHLAVAKDLGNRSYIGDLSKSAYERSQVPNIAGFTTFRTDNMVNSVVTGTVSGTTINGNQSHTVTSMTGDVPTDNRQMTLTVQGANVAGIKAGDSFTITGVNAVHNIDKSDTGQLMTFRVLAVAGGGVTLTISPAIVATGPYQNVSAIAAASAPLVFLNTATKPVNPFWAQGAVCLDYGKLAFPSGEGAQVMTATTKNGVPLIMSYSFNHLTGVTTCRYTTLYAVSVRDPEQTGIIIANQ
jgi:hypothetical protein